MSRDDGPVRRGRVWVFADGRVIPVAAGGSGGSEGEAAGEGEGKTEGEGEGTGQEGEGKSEDASAELGRTKREAADLRRRLRAVESERDNLKAAGQTDAERREAEAQQTAKERDGLRDELRRVNVDLAVAKAASKRGIVDASLAAKLLDRSGLEYDDANRPSADSLSSALDAVVEEHSILTRQGDADGGRRGEAKTGASAVDDFIRGRGA